MTKQIPYSGGTFTFSIETDDNNTFTISSNAPFVRVNGGRVATVQVAPNESTSQRTARITVALTNDECIGVYNYLDIVQDGKEEEHEEINQYNLVIRSNRGGSAVANGITNLLIYKGPENYDTMFTFNEGTNVTYSRSPINDETPETIKSGLTASVNALEWSSTDDAPKTITLTASETQTEYNTYTMPSSGKTTMNSNQSVTLNVTATTHPEVVNTSVVSAATFSRTSQFEITKTSNGVYSIKPPSGTSTSVRSETVSFYLKGYNSVSVQLSKNSQSVTPQYKLTVYSNYSGTTTANNVTKTLAYKGTLSRYVAEYEYDSGTTVTVSRSNVSSSVPPKSYLGINLSTNSMAFNKDDNTPRQVSATTKWIIPQYTTYANPSATSVTMNTDKGVYLDVTGTTHPESSSNADRSGITIVSAPTKFAVSKVSDGVYRVTPPSNSTEAVNESATFACTNYNNATLQLSKAAMEQQYTIEVKVNNSDSYSFSAVGATANINVWLYDNGGNIVRDTSILNQISVSLPNVVSNNGNKIYPPSGDAPSFNQPIKASNNGSGDITASFTSGGITVTDTASVIVKETMVLRSGETTSYIQVMNGHSTSDSFDSFDISCNLSLFYNNGTYVVTFRYNTQTDTSHNNHSRVEQISLDKDGTHQLLSILELPYDVTYTNVVTTNFAVNNISPAGYGIAQEAYYSYGGNRTPLGGGATIVLKKGGYFQLYVSKQ